MGNVSCRLDVINYMSSGIKDIFYPTNLQRKPDKSFFLITLHIYSLISDVHLSALPQSFQCATIRTTADKRQLEAIPATYESKSLEILQD
jgi:hypothetical protein